MLRKLCFGPLALSRGQKHRVAYTFFFFKELVPEEKTRYFKNQYLFGIKNTFLQLRSRWIFWAQKTKRPDIDIPRKRTHFRTLRKREKSCHLLLPLVVSQGRRSRQCYLTWSLREATSHPYPGSARSDCCQTWQASGNAETPPGQLGLIKDKLWGQSLVCVHKCLTRVQTNMKRKYTLGVINHFVILKWANCWSTLILLWNLCMW